MHTPWIGKRRMLVIPTIVRGDPAYDPPPHRWTERIRERIFYDPDPATGIDRSLRTYVDAISYGLARLEADVSRPVTVDAAPDGSCRTVAAIQAHPTSHLYEYACVIFTTGSHPCRGMTAWHTAPIEFDPPRSPNLILNRCRVRMDESLGVWAMEVLHMTTAFGDLYNTNPHPGRFDEMACSCGTHPSAYTKLALGWLEAGHVPLMLGSGPSTFTLHAIALLEPPPPGRVAGVRIRSLTNPQRYFIVEARLRVDPYERQTAGVSAGIPSEGVVVYERDPNWPLQLRTPTALAAGQSFKSTESKFEIKVTDPVPGGFKVRIRSTEHPDCDDLRKEIAALRAEIRALQEELQSAAPPQKAAIVAQIRAATARLKSARERATSLGCHA